tara:strand:+ start:1935 stop:2159 length:225 start_codon:yes stop_codon:yes gene_type:complete
LLIPFRKPKGKVKKWQHEENVEHLHAVELGAILDTSQNGASHRQCAAAEQVQLQSETRCEDGAEQLRKTLQVNS